MDMEQVRTEPGASPGGAEPVVADPAATGTVTIHSGEPAADRDRLALEALEAELAVLEGELARVDADRSDPPSGEHR
jgi:hypothetical protein